MPAKTKAKGARTLLIELRKAERVSANLPEDRRAELRATIQTLSWALGMDAMAPVECVLIGVDL